MFLETGGLNETSKNGELTNGVALPAATPLSKAGAVHHVAFIVLFGESLVHLIGQTVHNTLICSGHINTGMMKNRTLFMQFLQVCVHVAQLQPKPNNVQVGWLMLSLYQMSDCTTHDL